MRTLHSGRFPLTGAPLLSLYDCRKVLVLLPLESARVVKECLGVSFVLDGTRDRISISGWNREVFHFQVQDSKNYRYMQVNQSVNYVKVK